MIMDARREFPHASLLRRHPSPGVWSAMALALPDPIFVSEVGQRGTDKREEMQLVQRYLPLLSNALISSWLPKNEMKRSVGLSWKIKRNARLPRHSNSLLANLRMPSPLWACGRPKLSSSSHKASKHSTLSVLGNSRSRFSTPGSMESGLANHLSQFFSRDRDEFSRLFEFAVTSVRGFFQGCDLFGGRSIFTLRVIRGFHLHFAQRDYVRSTDNADVFAAGGGSQPATEVFLGIRDSQRLHRVFISSAFDLVKSWRPTAPWRSLSSIRSGSCASKYNFCFRSEKRVSSVEGTGVEGQVTSNN